MAELRRPAALLLDLDGTLVDSEPVHREAYRRFFRARGWEHDDALLSLFTGRRADDVFARTPGPGSAEDPTALFHEVVSHHPHDLLPEPVAGARELVDDACARGIPCVLVTSAGRRWAVTALELLGGSERFAAMVTREDVTEGKPAPDGYLLAIRTLGVRAEDCLVAEDTPRRRPGRASRRRRDRRRRHHQLLGRGAPRRGRRPGAPRPARSHHACLTRAEQVCRRARPLLAEVTGPRR